MARDPGSATLVTLASFAFASVPFWIPCLEPPWLVRVFFSGVFALVGVFLFLFALSFWFYRSVSTRPRPIP
jgi:hypothetical protein